MGTTGNYDTLSDPSTPQLYSDVGNGFIEPPGSVDEGAPATAELPTIIRRTTVEEIVIPPMAPGTSIDNHDGTLGWQPPPLATAVLRGSR